MKNSQFDSGAYAVIYFLDSKREIEISKLGKFEFHKGYYVYSGSAKKNLRKRVERHIRKDGKKLRWHIDYFINDNHVKIKDHYLFENGDECKINKTFLKKGGKVVVKKFGASDCKNKCISHFLFLGDKYARMHIL